MPINNPPLRDLAGDDSEWTSPWAVWFTQVFSAIFGWRKTYTATKMHDFGNISAQSQDTTTVSVIGARSGDAVLVRPTTAVNGIILDGTVTALDTVTIRAANYSSGAIDSASQVYRVIVFQQ